MSSNLTQLRLRLKSNFPAFGNLTLADLQELKWSLRQLIFIEIFKSSNLLNESTEQLLNLGERREKKVAQWKAAGKSIDKDERLEFERDYRTSFMAVVLKGLEQTRWPPSQVPFADPMDDLLHNKETLLDSINHLLNTLYPSSVPPSAPPKRSTPSKVSLHQEEDEEELSDSGHEHTPPRPGSTKATPRDTNDSFHQPMDTATSSSISKRFGKMDVSHDIEPSTSRSSRGRSGGDKANDVEWNAPSSVRSSLRDSGYESHHGESATGDDKKLVEYLLYQNHLLSTQLHHLKQAVTRRSQVEITLSSLLQDVNKCLLDIVEVGVQSTASPPPKHSTEKAPATATAVSMDGVCRECGRSSGSSSAAGDARSSSKHDTKPSAAFSWRNISSKLKQLEAQWTEATRAARQMVSTNGSSSQGSSFGGHSRRMSSGIGGSRMGTAGSPSSGMLTSRSTASTMSTATFGTAGSRFTTAGGGGPSTAESSTGRTMAEKARQWVSASAAGTPLAHVQHMDASMATRDALQVECISLLSALEAWEISVAEETELTFTPTAANPQQQQHQLRRLWLQRCEQQSTLQSIVQRLLALLVVQPGGTVEEIESTGVRATDTMIQEASGRDVQHSAVGRLIHQIEEDVFPKIKKSSALLQSWTSLCDSAMMEHVLHVRQCSRQRREQLRWQRFLRQLVEKLSSFGRSTKKAMEESVQKISTLSKILQEMMRHVAQAEDSRVAGFGMSTGTTTSSAKRRGSTSSRSTGSGGDAMVSPMDSLCRGIAGPEVAALMQVLRQHHHTFRELDDELQELVQRFVKTLLWEQAGMQSFIRASLGHEIPSTAAVDDVKPSAQAKATPTSRSGRVRRL